MSNKKFIPFQDDTDEEEKDVVLPLDLPKGGRRHNLGMNRQMAPKPTKGKNKNGG